MKTEQLQRRELNDIQNIIPLRDSEFW